MMDYLDTVADVLGRGVLGATGRMGRMLSNVPVDITEDDEKYVVTATIAGYKKENVSVEYKDCVLSITGEMDVESEDNVDEARYLVRERAHSSFARSFAFKDVDENAIKAKMDNGVLVVTLAKLEKPNPSKIDID